MIKGIIIFFGAILLFFVLYLPFLALGALMTMLAWNIFFSVIFELSVITFWQALALNILGGLFFKVLRVFN